MKNFIFIMILLVAFMLPNVADAEKYMIDVSSDEWTATEYFPSSSGFNNSTSGKKYDKFIVTVLAVNLADTSNINLMGSADGTNWHYITAQQTMSAAGITGRKEFTYTATINYVRLEILTGTSGDDFSILGTAYRTQEYKAKIY